MAKSQTTSQQVGLTRGKAVLIGTLAVALVGVLYVQYGGFGSGEGVIPIDTAAPRGAASRPPRSTTAKTAATVAENDGDTQAALLAFDQAKWKSPELSTVIAYDPFALPPTFPQPPRFAGDSSVSAGATNGATAAEDAKQLADALEELRMQLEELKQRGVHVIVSQNDQYVAMIGDRMIHVGDEINGFTVTEIDPNEGVRVERKDPE
ncbi:MAG: hypothetical protein L0228_14140 [Planctomycetes bacterium]|nr:hypothetical protein [Planctomycetota bacterium]